MSTENKDGLLYGIPFLQRVATVCLVGPWKGTTKEEGTEMKRSTTITIWQTILHERSIVKSFVHPLCVGIFIVSVWRNLQFTFWRLLNFSVVPFQYLEWNNGQCPCTFRLLGIRKGDLGFCHPDVRDLYWRPSFTWDVY